MASTKRADGEGSIYQRHTVDCPPAVQTTGENGKIRLVRPKHTCKGPWTGSLVVGWSHGKPIRKKVSGKSRAAVAEKLRQTREKIEAQEMPVGTTPTVEKWLRYWLEEIAARKVRPSTLRGYTTYVDCYLIPLLGAKRIDKLTPEHISEAWAYLLDVGRPGVESPTPLSSTSVHQAHRVLARALKVAQQRGHVTRNVATLIDAPQPREVEIEPLTKDEALRVLEAARGRRNAARWRVAVSLGLRQGEALGLRWCDVDLERGTIAVRHALGRVKGKGLVLGPVKSRAGKRVVRLPKVMVEELKAHKRQQATDRLAAGTFWKGPSGDEGFVFARVDGTALSPSNDWREWKELLELAKVGDRRLHDARHTAATMLLAMGVPPRTTMEILGHSRITQTQRYQHVLDEMHDDAAERMDAYWG